MFLFTGWLFLTRVTFKLGGESLLGSREAVAALRRQLGPIRRDEVVTAAVFGLTALLWMTRKDVRLGDTTIPGWSRLFASGFVDDAVVAMTTAILLFLLPSKSRPGWG